MLFAKALFGCSLLSNRIANSYGAECLPPVSKRFHKNHRFLSDGDDNRDNRRNSPPQQSANLSIGSKTRSLRPTIAPTVNSSPAERST